MRLLPGAVCWSYNYVVTTTTTALSHNYTLQSPTHVLTMPALPRCRSCGRGSSAGQIAPRRGRLELSLFASILRRPVQAVQAGRVDSGLAREWHAARGRIDHAH
jgi:hypothetical protein